MKKHYLIILASLCAIAIGCNNKYDEETPEAEEHMVTITAIQESQPETKTSRQEDGSIYWSPGDNLSVFYGSGSAGGSKFTSNNTAPAATATFSGSLPSLDGQTWVTALYPYSPIASCDEDGAIHTYLPSVQTAVANGFDEDLFISIGRSKDLNIPFYNVCGGVKFKVMKDNVTKAVLSAPASSIAGEIKIGWDGNDMPYILDYISFEPDITLEAPEGTTFSTDAWYYFVTLPTYLGQFTITLYDGDDVLSSYTHGTEVSVLRSYFGRLSTQMGFDKAEAMKYITGGTSIRKWGWATDDDIYWGRPITWGYTTSSGDGKSFTKGVIGSGPDRGYTAADLINQLNTYSVTGEETGEEQDGAYMLFGDDHVCTYAPDGTKIRGANCQIIWYDGARHDGWELGKIIVSEPGTLFPFRAGYYPAKYMTEFDIMYLDETDMTLVSMDGNVPGNNNRITWWKFKATDCEGDSDFTNIPITHIDNGNDYWN